MKNPTPREVAISVAGRITGIIVLLILITKIFFSPEIYWGHIIAIGLLTFFITFLIVLSAIQQFIYRKIKLIYKKISTIKLGDIEKVKQFRSDIDVISEADEQVNEWLDSSNREIEKLKIEEAYRKEYLGNVAHELKTPLFTIQGYVETLIDGALTDSNVNMKYLNKAKKNIKRLNKIIDDLDTINVLESETFELEREVFDIHALTIEVFEELEVKAKGFDISLQVKEGIEGKFMVYGDEEKVRQVLINLVENSIKYGRQNGSTSVGFYDMEKYILTEVSDDGKGIAEEDIPRLFERFYRVEKSRSRDRGGTGLGLAIVKHIIEAHRQSINVRSKLGFGSTFGFTMQKAS